MLGNKLRFALLGALTASVFVGFAPAAYTYAQSAAPTSYTLPGDKVFPEGIAYQPETGNFYVSSAADGTIFRGSLNNPTIGIFEAAGSDGRTSATGLKVDQGGRLYVSGGATGTMAVYDTYTGKLIAKFSNDKAASATFVNDVALAQNGEAYFTDSTSPVIYRLEANGRGVFTYEEWLSLTGSPIVYGTGFNLNGIAATADGQYLVVVQSNTGKLFRISTATKEVREIDLGGQTVTNGDGILLSGSTLLVCRNQNAIIVSIQMSSDLLQGTVTSTLSDASFAYPTTFAQAGDRLLVVNSQFDKQGGTPVLPFTVSSVAAPSTVAVPVGMPRTGEPGDWAGLMATVALTLVAMGTLLMKRQAKQP